MLELPSEVNSIAPQTYGHDTRPRLAPSTGDVKAPVDRPPTREAPHAGILWRRWQDGHAGRGGLQHEGDLWCGLTPNSAFGGFVAQGVRGWTEKALAARLKHDPGKLAIAARVRKETTLPA